jgi:riboflavin biosynthesis pyrimidine reductase
MNNSMWVAASVAQSIDGKIATSENGKLRIGSDLDLKVLRTRRSQFDAVLVGGNTFRAWPLPYSTTKPIHNIVLSRQSLHSHVTAPERWGKSGVTLHFLTPAGGYPEGIRWAPVTIGIPDVLKYCSRLGVKRLLIEGGGTLISAFVGYHPIHELFVTISSKLIGGADSPTLFDGNALTPPTRYQNVSCESTGEEIFLHYKLKNGPDGD